MNSKYIAGISLIVMAAGFVVTLMLPDYTWILLLQGGFEAGLVGGIADWFAVTALFRHPMGIPIPHTSLLLKNKDRIVQSLVSAIETELLNKESIEKKLRGWNLVERVNAFATQAVQKKKARRQVLDRAIHLVERLPVEKLAPVVKSGLATYVRQIELHQAFDQLATYLIKESYDEKALDYVLEEAESWARRLETKRMLGRVANEKLAEVKLGGLKGFAFQAFAGFMDEDKLGQLLQGMITSSLQDLRDEDNEYRTMIIQEIRVQVFQLAMHEEKVGRLKTWLLEHIQHERFDEMIRERLEEIRTMALHALARERDTGGRIVLHVYRAAAQQLKANPEWIHEIENRVSQAVVAVVEKNHYRIGQLVKENVNQMDDEALIEMLEGKIGKDLQWIRVNGALCGFVIGLLLAAIQLFL
ncbi:DUF445 domain-containing protein [Paenibacillus apiarius]|uniref:DUF445 domain-containing protein n=1 Tax=Paenibacillus apiarius TaxID=46240 RepID=A0ABT4DVK0_9BACL|nr:DUF445 domain-containing protein [Paenibacillus apiarius]MCY9513259.1 DUF445 domain-containing protein [Paenibacillus apiarius]MCY9521382.1 DUF445 domain-containing protein [Paenibacillus apiarius]MCY9554472.1 DUF445 domain-containing protein [Paenibacillus apiarius]MCY9560675.1 DUF445 domain-containing protein [Paenibacillus apiarius]MCY9685074.1 DUF445 domain-containing protein [Paenibacillus apiarius]